MTPIRSLAGNKGAMGMRIGFLPTVPREVYLREHADLSPDDRPTLVCRTQTKAEFETLWADIVESQRRIAEAITNSGDVEPDSVTAVRFLSRVVTGWRNIRDAGGSPIAFDLSRLPTLCTASQMAELFSAAIDERSMWDADAGKASRSPLSSPVGKSASNAAAGSAANN